MRNTIVQVTNPFCSVKLVKLYAGSAEKLFWITVGGVRAFLVDPLR